MKRILAALLLIMALAPVVGAVESIKIHGKVTDREDKPIEFVTVSIGGTSVGTNTGLQGEYSLTTAKADTVTVYFACIGYKEEKRVLIDPQGDLTINIKMAVKDNVLQEVEITDFKRQTGGMSIIGLDNRHLQPDMNGGSVEGIIATQAGVSQSNEMSSQYSVRGGSYDENLVYINGIEVYRPLLVSSGEQEGLSIINPDLVGSVKFSTGGFSSEYGDKMSSALDIQYKDPQAFEGALSASLMGGSLAIGQSSGKFSQLHGVRYKRNSSLLGSMDTKGEYDPSFFDYQTSITLKPSKHFSVNFLGNVAINNYTFTPKDRKTNFGTISDAKQFTVYFDGHEKDKFETWFGALSLNYRRNKSTDFTLLAGGFLSNELVSYDISGEYWLDQAGSDNVGGELGVGRYHEHARNRLKSSVLTLSLKGNTGIAHHNLTYGLQLNSEKIMERSREWERRDSAGYSLPFDPDALKVVYNLNSRQDLTSTRFAIFVEDAFKSQTNLGYLTVNGGIRLSHWSFNKETLISPRLSFSLIPDAHPLWTFRFATGLYYQSPFFKEFRISQTDALGNQTIALNKDIKSQRSFQFIFGADYTFRTLNRPFKLTGEAYCKLLGNLIPYEVDNLKIVYSGYNTSKGYAMGLDMKLFGQFVPGTDSWVSFSLMKTQEDLNGVKVPRPTDRRYSMALYFTDYFPKFPKLKFSLRGIFSDGLPTTAPRSSRDKGYFRTPAYKRVDIGFSYALLPELAEGETRTGFLSHIKSVWLGLDVFNLLDISNVSSYYWVTDVNEIQYAVPNYLTRRQINLRLSIDF